MSLLQLARKGSWSSIVQRIQEHPCEILNQDENGWNVFHHVCHRRPPRNLIRYLLHLLQPAENNPTIIGEDSGYESDDDYEYERLFPMKTNNSGCTALHYACQYASPEVVWEITRLYPEAVSVTDSEGLTTLNYVCMSDRSVNTPHDDFYKTLMLLEVDPSLVAQNQHLLSPIALHCRKYEMEIKQLINDEQITQQTEVSLVEFLRGLILLASFSKNEHDRKNDKMMQTLRDPAKFSRFPFLHPLLKLPIQKRSDCILVNMLLAILKIYPEQALMTDVNGDLPLHTVLSKHHIFPRDKLLLLIQALLSAHPHSAQCKDSNGKLPFHLAVENGLKMDHGLKSIIAAYPGVIVNSPVFSEDERLLPLALATVGCDGSLSLTFELLKEQPFVFCEAMVSD